MATKMQMAELELVDESHPNAQKVAVLNAPYDISIAYAAIPETAPDEIRLKVKWVGICGSDVEAYRGTRKPEYLSTPARLGHEVAGIVDQVGKHVTGIKVGDRVACRYVWGAFAEYITCKPFNVRVMPPDFPMREISLIEVLPGVIHTADLSKIGANTTVLITGQGVSGLVLTQVISLYSPRALVVTDLKAQNLELARRYGATHTYQIPTPNTPTMEVVVADFPDGFDVVIPCLLEGDGMVDAIACAAMRGKIVMYGCIGVCNTPVDFFKVHRKRLEIYSTEPRTDIEMRHYFDQGVRLVMDGLVNTSEMITDTLALDRIDEAFKLREDETNDSIHVLIDCGG